MVVARALRSAFPAAISIALVLASGSASAQQDDAERLFREGQKLMEDRLYAQACPKFEAAYQKDRALGTLINLAFCHKEQGNLWYAWLEFREADVKATEEKRAKGRDFITQHLVELEKQLPRLKLEIPPKVIVTDVFIDDKRVPEAERGAPFAAEPGSRKFVFKAKGKKATSKLIEVKGDRSLQKFVLPEMEDGTDEPPPPPPVVTPETPKADPGPAKDENPGKTQRTIGWVAIGVGGVALIVGIIEGALTFSSSCSGGAKVAEGTKCDKATADSATTTGAIANVSWVLAGVGIIGGGALILTAPSAPPPQSKAVSIAPAPNARIVVTPRIGAGWAGLSGTF